MALVIVIWSNGAGLLMAVILVLTVLPGRPLPDDLALGVAAGLCGSAGPVLLFRALARGVMSVVAPASAATAAAVPVLVGSLLGEVVTVRTGMGIALALVSIVLISRAVDTPRDGADAPRRRTGLAEALLAGAVFGAFLVLLSRTSTDSSLYPLVSARGASLTVLVAILLIRRQSARLAPPTQRLAVASGGLDLLSTVAYVIAVRQGPLAVIGLLASLAPLATVGLARVVLRERIRPGQRVGAALAVSSVVLLAS